MERMVSSARAPGARVLNSGYLRTEAGLAAAGFADLGLMLSRKTNGSIH